VGEVVGVGVRFDWDVAVGVGVDEGTPEGFSELVGVLVWVGVGVDPPTGVLVGRKALIDASPGPTQALALEVKIQKEMRVIASRKQLASLELPYGRFEGSIQKPFHNSIEMKLYP
jgi:hypothetical protein